MSEHINFFDESAGRKSSMRLMSFVSLLAAVAFGALTILQKQSDPGVYITTMFLIGAFAPKTIQKFAEK